MSNFSTGNPIQNGVYQMQQQISGCPGPVQVNGYPAMQSPNHQGFYHQMPQKSPSNQMVYTSPVHQTTKGHQFPSPHDLAMKRMKQNEMINDTKQFDQDGANKARKIDSVFAELQRTCSEGCTMTEAIAQNYRRRPCFKKIELLLSRLKHELNVHQNIVSNINSQGTAWVVKDFIFVFTRIINAWIIMRGYIYDTSRELETLREEFDPDFIVSFLEWQHSTLKMMRCLISSVDMLNVHTLNKDSSKKKTEKQNRTEPFEHKQYDEEFLENFQKDLFTPRCVENSEEIQLRNHHSNAYFRAGVLKPLMMPNKHSSPFSPMSPMTPDSSYTFNDSDAFVSSWFSSDNLNDSPNVSSANSERLYNRGRASMPGTPYEGNGKNPFNFDVKPSPRAKKGLIEQFNSMELQQSPEEESCLSIDVNSLVDNQEHLNDMYKGDAVKIVYLIREIAKLPHVDDFALSINMMISSIKVGKYGKLADVLGELKILVQQAKSLMKNADDTKKISLKVFVSGLEGVMNRKAFE